MNNLFIIVSISKSGKSTWCNKVSKTNNITIVSLDTIKILFPNKSSHLIAFDLIDKQLKLGDVLFDANNCKYEHRLNLLNSLTAKCNKYAIVFHNVSVEKSILNLIEYNKTNTAYVTPTHIQRQYNDFKSDIDKLDEFKVITKTSFIQKHYDKNI